MSIIYIIYVFVTIALVVAGFILYRNFVSKSALIAEPLNSKVVYYPVLRRALAGGVSSFIFIICFIMLFYINDFPLTAENVLTFHNLIIALVIAAFGFVGFKTLSNLKLPQLIFREDGFDYRTNGSSNALGSFFSNSANPKDFTFIPFSNISKVAATKNHTTYMPLKLTTVDGQNKEIALHLDNYKQAEDIATYINSKIH